MAIDADADFGGGSVVDGFHLAAADGTEGDHFAGFRRLFNRGSHVSERNVCRVSYIRSFLLQLAKNLFKVGLRAK